MVIRRGLLPAGLVLLLLCGCGGGSGTPPAGRSAVPPGTVTGAGDVTRAGGVPGTAEVTRGGRFAAAATPAGRCPADGRGFALSLVSDRHGSATPEQAASSFSRRTTLAGFRRPASRWAVVARDRGGVTVRSGPVELYALRGADRTWQISSGHRCP